MIRRPAAVVSRRALLGAAAALCATRGWAQEAAGTVAEPAPVPTSNPDLDALRVEARSLEALVAQSGGAPFAFDPEDTIVVLSGVVELAFSQTPRGRVLGACMGRVDGVFDTLSGDLTVQFHGFVPVDGARQSGLLVGLEVPLSGFASLPETGAPKAWIEAKDVPVGKRPQGGRADWRAEGRMLGAKPGRLIVGPITGNWTPMGGGRLVVQGAWGVREGSAR